MGPRRQVGWALGCPASRQLLARGCRLPAGNRSSRRRAAGAGGAHARETAHDGARNRRTLTGGEALGREGLEWLGASAPSHRQLLTIIVGPTADALLDECGSAQQGLVAVRVLSQELPAPNSRAKWFPSSGSAVSGPRGACAVGLATGPSTRSGHGWQVDAGDAAMLGLSWTAVDRNHRVVKNVVYG